MLKQKHKKLLELNTELVKQAEMTQKENTQLKYKIQNLQDEKKEKRKDINSVMSVNKELTTKLNYVMKMQPSWMNALKSKEYLEFKEEQNNLKRPKLSEVRPVEEIKEREKTERPKLNNSIPNRNDLKNKIEEDQKKTSQFEMSHSRPKL